MAKQGERYDPKTKTGWKFENGQSNYYVKGKKLSQIEIVKRGLAQGGENIKGFASDVFSPLTSGAQTLKAKMTRDPRSSMGDNVWTHNKKLLALQAQLDKDPQVIANQQALAASQSPAEFFGTNQYGDQSAQFNDPSSPLYKDGGTEVAKVSQNGQILSLNGSPELMELGNNVNKLLVNGNVSQASATEPIKGDALTTEEITNNIEEGSGGGDTAVGKVNSQETNVEPGETTDKEPKTKQRYNPNAGHKNYDVESTAKGTAALSIQKKLLDAGFKQSDLNALAKNKRQSPIKALSNLFIPKGK